MHPDLGNRLHVRRDFTAVISVLLSRYHTVSCLCKLLIWCGILRYQRDTVWLHEMGEVGAASGNGQDSTISHCSGPSSRKRSFSRRHIENENFSSAVLHMPFSNTALESPRLNWRVSRTARSTNQATKATRKAASLLQTNFLIVLKFPFSEGFHAESIKGAWQRFGTNGPFFGGTLQNLPNAC